MIISEYDAGINRAHKNYKKDERNERNKNVFIKLLFSVIAVLMLNGCLEVRDNQEIEALYQQGMTLFNDSLKLGSDEHAVLQMTEGIKKMEQANAWCIQNYSCKMDLEKNKRHIIGATALRGIHKLQMRDYDSAIPDLERVSEYDAMFLVYLGELYIKKGDIKKAKEQLYRLEEREEKELREQLSAIIKNKTYK